MIHQWSMTWLSYTIHLDTKSQNQAAEPWIPNPLQEPLTFSYNTNTWRICASDGNLSSSTLCVSVSTFISTNMIEGFGLDIRYRLRVDIEAWNIIHPSFWFETRSFKSSQDQDQKRVESETRLIPHSPESITRPRQWKCGLFIDLGACWLSVDSDSTIALVIG